ncbi:MAG TPA: flagellar biosynthesis protein FlhF [Treponemataceae bacterium]|nr:flagellar biosynthesis protein FlhF [Treponemataceae bacterium]HQL33845.1 flagellar biosynthesis protein FlhF [Treponemataceae bacterium]
MDILTEQGATYDDCITRIRDKYGPNVHILRQKTVRTGGFLGFFERDAIEVNFILTRDPLKYVTQNVPIRTTDFEEERKKILKNAATSSPAIAARLSPLSENPFKNAQVKETSNEQERIEAILQAVKKLEAKIDRPRESAQSAEEEHESIRKIENLLELNDFSSSYTKKIVSRIRSEFTLEELEQYDHVQDIVVEWIGASIPVYDSISTARPRVIVLVGPTGVGKTTTVAKLAAAFSLATARGERSLNVRIVTIDNYRIGAKQQIEIYGNIMNIPVSCAEKPSDLVTFMASNNDADIILVDTIGKSPKDYTKIAEMRQFLDSAGSISDMHLALSATTKFSDMKEILQQYETFGFGSIIITKFDETTRVGNIISVLSERQKPVAYITTGQRVPQDFEQASVVRFLTNLEGFRINRARIEELFPVPENRFKWR